MVTSPMYRYRYNTFRMSCLSQDPGHLFLREVFYQDYKNQVETSSRVNQVTVIKVNVDVTFLTADGSIKCHSKLLSFLSPFFKNKIEGSKNLGSPLEFDYKAYKPKAIKWFLDYCYCVAEPVQNLHVVNILSIMYFLHAEGKTVVSGSHQILR